ncbi:MAG: hypothetical protein CMJ48_08000 [Planctomycetaceae bacterium]|nr:hypothetical protein [Planctomycetaceae bacterium]
MMSRQGLVIEGGEWRQDHPRLDRNQTSRIRKSSIVALLLSGFLFGPVCIVHAQELNGDKTPKNKKTQDEGKPSQQQVVTNRVIVKPLSKPKRMGGCGGFFWPVFLELESKTSKGGWIVQEVKVVEKIYHCDGRLYDESTTTFWEAWEVDANASIPNNREPQLDPTNPDGEGTEFDDTYLHGPYPKRSVRSRGSRRGLELPPSGSARGTIEIQGWVKFHEGVKLSKRFKRGNRRTMAGQFLLSSHKEPSFWKKDGATLHNLTWKWDCCGDSGTGTSAPPITVPAFIDPTENSGSVLTGEDGKTTGKTAENGEESKSESNGKDEEPSTGKSKGNSKGNDKEPQSESKTPEDQSSNSATDLGEDVFSGASTALAEAVLPEGTPVLTAPVTIDTSESLAGIPNQSTIDTHRLPFTVVKKGQLRATVRAAFRRRVTGGDSP